MSDQTITPDGVIAAINAGCDDTDRLAKHFGVPADSHTLTSTVHRLFDDGRVKVRPDDNYRLAVA